MNEVEWQGQTGFWLDGVAVRRRWDGLDELSGTYFADSFTALAPGDNCPSPWASFKVRDVEVNTEPEDMAELRVTGVGVLGTKGQRRVSSSWTNTQEGFDEGVEVWITNTRTNFDIGSQSTTEPAMYVTDATFDELDVDFQYYRCTAKLKGILKTKDQKTMISTSAREMGVENIVVNIPGGWTTPASGDVLWPRPEVKTSYIQIGGPSMVDIPSLAVPPFIPGVWSPPLTGELKYHAPGGWVITGRDAENLVGTNVWFVTETYIYNHPATF